MASPIHKYLFSPPPSPPAYPADRLRSRSPALESLQSLLPPDLNLLPRPSSENELKVRTPRTPQTNRFTLDTAFPSPSTRLGGKESFTLTVEDTSRPCSPRPPKHDSYLPTNVPTVPAQTSISLSIPRPLLRLLILCSLLMSSICMLVFIPAARLPSLRAASISRRLALAPDGRAYVDVMDPITSWEESRDRDYVPPQIYADRIQRRVPVAAQQQQPIKERVPAPHPKSKRPSARPLPRTHELLALQSYLLQSSYNTLPAHIDPTVPLDASLILGYAASDEALVELEAERSNDIVVWYGADGLGTQPHELLDLLQSVHGSHRHPTLINIHSRPDKDRLLKVLHRLEMPLEHGAVVMIGNRPLEGDVREIGEMKDSGKLELMLSSIGWAEKKDAKGKKGWKPKVAKLKRKEKSEVEHALDEVKRR